MIQFEKYSLDNGLRVLLHQDQSSPLVVVNVLYDVGSRDEDPDKTGFAHLFEHLMFGGSLNVPDFDTPIQLSGGENNAFTNSDVTNYYNTVPKDNLEIALWLESDRMIKLDFNQGMLDIQKKVVVEEFKETCLNVPYGDSWHELNKLSYKIHPYQWPTLGKNFSHIEGANLTDVKDFFYKHYIPNNAILCISGNFDNKTIRSTIEKWFGAIPAGLKTIRKLDSEQPQKKANRLIKKANVPGKNITVAYHMVDRLHPDYLVFDLISDLLSSGKSSRFYQKLVKSKNIFNNLGAYISGSSDPGLFIVEGRINPKIDPETAYQSIQNEISLLATELISEYELTKVKNQIISILEFSEISILNKAINLSHFELMGNADLINQQADLYNAITVEDIRRVASESLIDSNSNTLIYLPKDK